jgi:hypothetical protein
MNDRDRLDEQISRLVRSSDREVPAGLEAKIRAAAAGSDLRPSWWPGFRVLIPALAGGLAAAALLFLLILLPGIPRRGPILVSEIRTEFEIPEKNIKIIFFQRPNFQLPKEGHE